MVRMPIKTFAVSAALALAMVILTVPLGEAVQAANPMHGWMLHDGGGSARFKPNELPDPFERDFDGDCVWWRYELHNGHYVRKYTPCRYGDQEISYRKDTHRLWAETPAPVTEVSATAEESAAVASPGTAGKIPQPAEMAETSEPEAAAEEAPAEEMAAEEVPAEEMAAEEAPAEEMAVEEAPAEEATIEAAPAEAPTTDIVDTLVEASDFAALLAAEGATDMVDMLRDQGPFTLFAPNDQAFAALPEGSLDELLADASGELTQIVKYHVVSGIVTSEDLTDGAQLETLQGGLLTVSVDGDSVRVGNANVIYPDIQTTNGVIHVIDAVLLPPAE